MPEGQNNGDYVQMTFPVPVELGTVLGIYKDHLGLGIPESPTGFIYLNNGYIGLAELGDIVSGVGPARHFIRMVPLEGEWGPVSLLTKTDEIKVVCGPGLEADVFYEVSPLVEQSVLTHLSEREELRRRYDVYGQHSILQGK